MARKYSTEDLKHIEEKYRELVGTSNQSYLIVDPSVPGRKAVSMVLKKAGCENVFEEKNGIMALARTGEVEGHLTVLAELNLSDMPLVKFLKALRNREPFAESKVILITGETREQFLQPARDAGIDAFFIKPVGEEALVDKLRELKVL